MVVSTMVNVVYKRSGGLAGRKGEKAHRVAVSLVGLGMHV
jgi:hypothetical protein